MLLLLRFNVVFIYLLVLCYYCYIIPSFNVVFIYLYVTTVILFLVLIWYSFTY